MMCLGTETVEGTARALESVNDVEGSDGLPVITISRQIQFDINAEMIVGLTSLHAQCR